MLAIATGTVPMICIVRRLMKHALAVREPKDERSFPAAIGDTFLKIPHSGINIFLQPIAGIIWV